MEKKKEEGLRFNQGKTRYDLVPAFAQEQYAKVLTKGAEKYGDSNWKLGMRWSKVLASLERHLAAIKLGEDIDSETGLLHAAHIMCNAAFLTEYYKIYPQGDDRSHNYLNKPKIGLDVDEVICQFLKGWCEKYSLPIPTSWSFDYELQDKFKQLSKNGELDEFYLNLKPKLDPLDLPFVPECYISHRPVSDEITKKWLSINGFPLKPVIHVENREDKLQVAKNMKLDFYVDDNFDTFVYMNQNGVCTYLMDAEHNKRHEVGYKRLYNLKDLV